MADEIKPEVIKKTQNSLGKYIKKPPLTEKLLRKPPFRFLHDIISAVIKETGFLEGLFTEDELNLDFKDKEAKIAYLTKLINVVKLVTGVELTARPVKIVCGQEPTKTNQLLQAIASALDKNINSAEAIQHYKTSVEKNKGKSLHSPKDEQIKTTDAKHSTQGRKVTEQHDKVHKSTRASNAAGTTRKQSEKHEKGMKNKDGLSTGKSQSTKKISSSTIEKSENRKVSQIERKQPPEINSDNIQAQYCDRSEAKLIPELKIEGKINQNEAGDNPIVKVASEATVDSKEPESIDKTPKTEKTTPSLNQDTEISVNVTETTEPSVVEQPVKNLLRPPSGRPSSARPAAPKLRWKPELSMKNNDLLLMENESVILDSFDTQDDDKDSMVIVETETHENFAANNNNETKNSDITEEHGYLVAQILETQRELAKSTTISHVPNKIDKDADGSSKKMRETTTVVQEVDKLRDKIQTLTRATNPMGNLLDFWQEDVELMQKELFQWRKQFKELQNELKIEKTSSNTWAKEKEEALSEIKTAINDEIDKIYHIKLDIIKNNQKIQQLLDGRG